MANSSPARLSSRRWEIAIAAVAGAGVIAAIAFAVAVALPPTIVNLSTSVSDGVAPFVLEEAGDTAQLTLPAGWVVERKNAADLLVWTPDGRMTATVTLSPTSCRTALAELIDVGSTLQTEVLASGLTVIHTDRQRGVGVIAGVSLTDASAKGPTLLVTTTIADEDDPSEYDLALAELLEGVG